MKWYDDYEATLLEKVNSIIEMFHHYLFVSTELKFLLSDISQGKKIDFEERCNIFKYGEITTTYTHTKDGMEQEYYTRTVLEYYILLVNKFLEMKPNVQRCKCCGNFFVTKTKEKLCTATELCIRAAKLARTLHRRQCKSILLKMMKL